VAGHSALRPTGKTSTNGRRAQARRGHAATAGSRAPEVAPAPRRSARSRGRP
jgi:hypothetical protein